MPRSSSSISSLRTGRPLGGGDLRSGEDLVRCGVGHPGSPFVRVDDEAGQGLRIEVGRFLGHHVAVGGTARTDATGVGSSRNAASAPSAPASTQLDRLGGRLRVRDGARRRPPRHRSRPAVRGPRRAASRRAPERRRRRPGGTARRPRGAPCSIAAAASRPEPEPAGPTSGEAGRVEPIAERVGVDSRGGPRTTRRARPAAPERRRLPGRARPGASAAP